ncbi:hypothetical protein GJ496_011960 [Pomphorhynchus laevis]|nr:hypothetical protein GJ496_011960 [Pomphorhynchus laevis]
MTNLFEEYENVMGGFHHCNISTSDSLDFQSETLMTESSSSLSIEKKVVNSKSRCKDSIRIVQIVNENIVIGCKMSINYFNRLDHNSYGENLVGDAVLSLCIEPRTKCTIVATKSHLYKLNLNERQLSILPYHHEVLGNIVVMTADSRNPNVEFVDFILATDIGKLLHLQIVKNTQRLHRCQEIYKFAPIQTILQIQIVTSSNKYACAILVLTEGRLYYFVDNGFMDNDNAVDKVETHSKFSTLDQIFYRFASNEMTNFKEFPKGPTGMCTSQQSNSESVIVTWLAGPGVLKCEIDFESMQLVRNQIINYPSSFELRENCQPVSMASTPHHVFILFSNNYVYVFNLLSEQLVGYDRFIVEKYGTPISLVKDECTGTIWVHTETTLFRYRIRNETSNDWIVYLRDKRFNDAINACTKTGQVSVVKSLESDFLLQIQSYEKLPGCLAQSAKDFSECILIMMKLKNNILLIEYLICKLRLIQKDIHRNAIATTIISVYINDYLIGDGSTCLDSLQNNIANEPIFLSSLKSVKSTVYKLICQREVYDIGVIIARGLCDHDTVIDFYMRQNEYVLAATYLIELVNSAFFYKYCTNRKIMFARFEDIIQAWKDMGPFLDISLMLRGIVVLISFANIKQILLMCDYIEYTIYELLEPNVHVHDLLLTIYIRFNFVDKLETYLKKTNANRKIQFSMDIIVLMLSQMKKYGILFSLYSCLNLSLASVQAALKIDLRTAINQAKKIESRDDYISCIMLIVKHLSKMVTSQLDPNAITMMEMLSSIANTEGVDAIDVLKLCPDWLDASRLADILKPCMIRIYQSIENYKHMQVRRQSGLINSSILNNNRLLVKRDSARCAKCNRSFALNSKMLVFPCGHTFHCNDKQTCNNATDRCTQCLPDLTSQLILSKPDMV